MIEARGFKSFADKVEIPFSDGFTAIIGPNGCGKSNVSDSIKWVLGEQRAKQLRGTVMSDVIFCGSDHRGMMSYCEVSLLFDNSDKKLFPTLPFDEVMITRKLDRSGKSEYFINRTSCLRRDIINMLHDTGMGKDGYSIIGQGRVDEVLSAKPMRYTVKNVTRPDADVIYPGDSLYIQMAGLFHPAMKLSGIYNHSAYIHYNGIINGDGSLILSPNQYAFGGNPKAQLFTLRIPMSYDKEEYVMTEGVLQMKGFGSVAGKHRAIDRIAGVNPNFQAAVTTNYWGSLPDITLKVESLTDGFKFTGLPEGIEPVVLSEKNDTLKPNEEGVYRAAPGNYRYEVLALGYKAKFGELTLAEGEGIKNVECTLTAVAADDISWDGESIELPDTVTKAESDTEGGQFEGLSGYYKITNGYELAWFSYYINRGNSTTNAVLTRDIDLAGKAWTVISPDFSKQFSGVFDGGNHKVARQAIRVSSAMFLTALYVTSR